VTGRLIPLDGATKLALSLGVGLFCGFEREWSRKDAGVRTFALTALLGAIFLLIKIIGAIGKTRQRLTPPA
jgi:uncharacterized membrane protein YhiD involved in acid resistance